MHFLVKGGVGVSLGAHNNSPSCCICIWIHLHHLAAVPSYTDNRSPDVRGFGSLIRLAAPDWL